MTVTPQPPTAEHHRVPLGIGESRPRLSWQITGTGPWSQAGYELEVTRGGACSVTRVTSPEQLLPWPIEPLRSRERVSVRVRVFDASGRHSPWSGPTAIEAGLLRPDDWVARPVGAAWPEGPESDRRRPAAASCTSGRCGTPGRPTRTRWPGAGTRNGSPGSRSTASGTSRSTAGPATSTGPWTTATSSRGSTTPTWPAPACSSAPTQR
jgi:hypothetical protein